MNQSKTIIDLNDADARTYLLGDSCYFYHKLPEYFVFSKILSEISLSIAGNELSNFYLTNKVRPDQYSDVNYKLLDNKNSRYSWRPFQLIHPAIYVSLVQDITNVHNWKLLRDRFEQFSKNTNIECRSIPIISDKSVYKTSDQILNWWQQIEQNSIALGLRYEYMFQTDIQSCYESIYTHSIAWALHGIPNSKKNRGIDLLGNKIDWYLREMSYGQTNGIPQGSVLMDLIAELILGYADETLGEKLISMKITEYKILRYRDDYRIFVNNPILGQEILKYLTEILSNLGFSLNDRKTNFSGNIIRDSLKVDKIYRMSSIISATNIFTHLHNIYTLGEKYPNSGALIIELNDFYKRLMQTDLSDIKSQIEVLMSIVVNIAYKNPRSYPVISGIISRLLMGVKNNHSRMILLQDIKNKFNIVPNTGYLQIWLQRISIKIDPTMGYQELLCDKVRDSEVKIWNSDWLNKSIGDVVNQTVIDSSIVDTMDYLIDDSEFSSFAEY